MKPVKWGKLLGLAVVFVAGLVGYFFGRAQLLEYRFRQLHSDESEARLLEIAGKPTSIRRCDEGPRKLAPHSLVNDESPGARRCARVYWYSAYPLIDGWLVPIDEAGTIMQIDRYGLP